MFLATQRLRWEFKRHRSRTVLVVRGKKSYGLSGAELLLRNLLTDHVVTEWNEFSPNPSFDQLKEGILIARDVKPSLIIGVGGGSALDLAKIIAVLWDKEPGREEDLVTQGENFYRRTSRLVLIPTTSGSGSEATHFAVIYVKGEKFSVSGDGLLPDLAVVRGELSQSGTQLQKASPAADALCQAIESLWAKGSTRKSRRFARRALRLITISLVDFVMIGTDSAARRMAKGSHLAGKAINISQTTASHALAYKMTTDFSIPHGNAVALTIGALMDFLSEESSRLDRKSKQILQRRIFWVRGQLGFAPLERASSQFQRILESVGLISSLSLAGVKEDSQLSALAESVNAQRLSNNPIPLTQEDLVQILQASQL